MALVEIEAPQREENAHQKRLRMARFPVLKSLDQFDFTALPCLNKARVLDLAQGGYLDKRENLSLMGNRAAPARPIWPQPWGSWPANRAARCGSLPRPVSSTC